MPYAELFTPEQREKLDAELRPLEAVSNVLTGLIERITKDPEEDEVRKNMEAFAKMHGGAVAPPMSEENSQKVQRMLAKDHPRADPPGATAWPGSTRVG